MRTPLLIGACLMAMRLLAQQASWELVLPAPQQSGLHRIALSPEVIARSQPSLADLRLLDAAGNEVPFRLERGTTGQTTETLIGYPIIRHEVLPKSTVLELDLQQEELNGDVFIWVRNAVADKRIRVTGSADRQNWYMVKDEHVALRGLHGDPPHEVIRLALPYTAHKYLRLEINDSLTAPVQVLQAGAYRTEQEGATWVTDLQVRWSSAEHAGKTRILLTSEHGIALQALSFSVSDTLPFRRRAVLLGWEQQQQGRGRNKRSITTERVLGSFFLDSRDGLPIRLKAARGDSLLIEVENGDDRPLRFTEWRVHQLTVHLLAYLDRSTGYRLTTGDTEARAPKYDETPFTTGTAAVDTLATDERLQAIPHIGADSSPFDPSANWLWVVIIALASGMAWVAYRLLRAGA